MYLPEISIPTEEVVEVAGISITNTYILVLILSLGIAALFSLSLRNLRIIPHKVQNFVEWALETLFQFTDSITGSRTKSKEIFPLAATLFFLILSSNLIELVPGVGVIHFIRSPSSDLNFTFALAAFAMAYVNIAALCKLGFFSYSKKFFNFRSPILFFVGILEGLGEFSRIISLTFRLFGNLFAGEVLLMVISYLFAYVMPLPFLFLEVLVSFIQAFIFFSLTVIFYHTATQNEH
ncbi:MAG: F0F1 ATP synthase subunit A [Candidatus Pacebacteria bacterium]|nr:F0F1 ATP synthase subunit A [Candidatus Paceibacterota bacterium]